MASAPSQTAQLLTLVEEGTPAFAPALERLRERGAQAQLAVDAAVRQIVSDVRFGGDAMVRKHVERMEGRRPAALFARPYDGEQALSRLKPEHQAALKAV